MISDEIYIEIIYGDKHHTMSSFARDEAIVINGHSKSHAMTGWRIGFVLAPKEICKHILKVHQYNVACASTISQYAAIEAFSSGFDDTKSMRDAYLKRRDYTYKRLCQMNLETKLPDGAFYFFVKIPNRIKSPSFDFCVKLAQENKVVVVPGSSFLKLERDILD